MSDVDEQEPEPKRFALEMMSQAWRLVREYAWDDKYNRVYIIAVGTMWIVALCVFPRMVNADESPWHWLILPLTIFAQIATGRIVDTVRRWNEQQAEYDEEMRRDL